MFQPATLLSAIESKIIGPTVIVLGSPKHVVDLVTHLKGPVTCYQMDRYQAEKLQQELNEYAIDAEVRTLPDLWDLESRFQSAILPITTHGERELKVDLLEQSYQVLNPGGMLFSLSEYQADQLLPKWHKKVFGKCSELPASKRGSVFWSVRGEDQPRRRHQQIFHARLKDGPSHEFISRPGVFSYGRFDDGARALIEVPELTEGASVLDLGCGVGTVGILAADRVGPNGKITFVDSNVRAIDVTKLNCEANQLKQFEAIATHSMEGLHPNSFDFILANPPYYATSSIAQLFIEKSKALLKPGGSFFLVTKMINAVAEIMLPIYPTTSAFETRGYHVLQGIKES